MNLIDVEKLSQKLNYDAKWSGKNDSQSGIGRPLVGGQSGAGRTHKNSAQPNRHKANENTVKENALEGLLTAKKEMHRKQSLAL